MHCRTVIHSLNDMIGKIDAERHRLNDLLLQFADQCDSLKENQENCKNTLNDAQKDLNRINELANDAVLVKSARSEIEQINDRFLRFERTLLKLSCQNKSLGRIKFTDIEQVINNFNMYLEQYAKHLTVFKSLPEEKRQEALAIVEMQNMLSDEDNPNIRFHNDLSYEAYLDVMKNAIELLNSKLKQELRQDISTLMLCENEINQLYKQYRFDLAKTKPLANSLLKAQTTNMSHAKSPFNLMAIPGVVSKQDNQNLSSGFKI